MKKIKNITYADASELNQISVSESDKHFLFDLPSEILEYDLNGYGKVRNLIQQQIKGLLRNELMYDLYMYLESKNNLGKQIHVIFKESDKTIIKGMMYELLVSSD